jgi:hypothetical protein
MVRAGTTGLLKAKVQLVILIFNYRQLTCVRTGRL